MKKKRNMDVEWSYSGSRGPEHWHSLCEWYAKGARYPFQSPINLCHQETQPMAKQKISFFYQNEKFTEKEFKNTIHFIPYNTESYVVFNDVVYRLTDIHFHMPSEHRIDHRQSDLEFHLVHTNAQQENLVIGCLFNVIEQEEFGKILSKDFSNNPTHDYWFNPSIFLPDEKAHFHYVGSLTTPPTMGPVNWFVFDSIGKISRLFIDEFQEEVLENNNRPLQDRNGRPIFYSQ